MNPEYYKYLHSPHWAELRLRVFDKFGYRCEACLSEKCVQAHHLTYENFPDCPLEDLMPLCQRCHEEVHAPAVSAIVKSTPNGRHRRELILQEIRIIRGFKRIRYPLEKLLKYRARAERRLLQKKIKTARDLQRLEQCGAIL